MSTLEKTMETKIKAFFEPVFLEIMNESEKHIGHAGHDGSGESHFKIKIVSEKFQDQSRVDRQRMVYGLLDEEFGKTLHALSLKTLTPQENK